MGFKKFIISICGAFLGAFIIYNASFFMMLGDIELPFGCKGHVFAAALVGEPLGASLGYIVSLWKRWATKTKVTMVVASTLIGAFFSYGFIYLGLTISEKHILLLLLLQFLCVTALILIIGKIISILSNNAIQRIAANDGSR
jgi:hypothetical protein